MKNDHPSGSTDPSAEDVALTKRIREAGELLGVELTDHIILGDGYTSFLDLGLLPRKGD